MVPARAYAVVPAKKAPVLGRGSMRGVMLEVTPMPGVQDGDVVTLLGRDGQGNEIDINEVGALCDTIGYEVVCLIGKRVPRVYLKDGKQVGVVDYINPYRK